MKNKLFKRMAAVLSSSVLAASVLGTMPVYAETSTANAKDFAEELTASMPLEQRIAQMIMLDIRYWSEDGSAANRTGHENLNDDVAAFLEKYDFGGVCLFAENVTGTEQTTRFISQLQDTTSGGSADIPMLITADQEGGYIVRLGTGTDTCGNMALGATNDTQYAYDNADIIGKELSAVGINANLGPVLDVNNNPRNPVINIRSFSSDPQLVSKMGESYIQAMKDNSIIASAKHFPGHGDTDTDSHTGLPLINKTYDELKQCELIPFQSAIDAGADMIMTAHIQYPKIETGTYTSKSSGEEVYLPATLSKTILTDIMRNDMGFDGVIITDAMVMDALLQNFDIIDSSTLAINAGVDILLMPLVTWSPSDIADMENYIDTIEEAVKDGTIPESRINESCARIIRMKYEKGLFDQSDENIETKVSNALKTVGSKENHDKEMEITKKAITLVKNDNDTLPLSLGENEKVAFFYPWSSTINSYTYAFEKLKEDGIIPESAEAYYNCLDNRSADEFSDIVSDSKAVVISVETWSESYLDPASSSGARGKFIDDMIALAHSMDKKVIVMSMVLPYDVARFTEADAILAAYNHKRMPVIPGEYSGEMTTYGPNYPAAVFTVFGGNTPTGKLPVDIFVVDSNYKFTDEILYPLGYGLTYGSDEEEEPASETTTTTAPASKTTKAAASSKANSPATGDSSGAAVAFLILAGAAAFAARKKNED